MQETLNNLIERARGAIRFKWWAIGVAWGVCLLGWTVVTFLPSKYEASTRVFVDTRTALSPVIQGIAIQQDVAAHLNLAQEALIGEEQLDEIVRETGLDATIKTAQERAGLIDSLKKRIVINLQRTGEWGQTGGVIYTISYRDSDRERGLKTVEILLNSFIEDTLGGKRQGSEEASDFLRNEIAETEEHLREAEQRLAEFKKANVGVMPGAAGDYFTRLQTELDAARKARADLQVALSRRSELSRQLSGETPFTVATGTPGAAAMAGTRGGNDTTSQIADAERRLAALLLRFTEKHPDVIAARAEVEGLKARRAEELEALRRGDPNAALSSGAGANPIYQSIQLALNQVDVEIAELRGQIALHERKVGELQRLVNTAPEVEAEYARLNRDYDVTKAQYTALVERLQRTELGQDAQDKASDVRFEVIDPPNAGFSPVTPNRPALVTLVFLLALGLGGATAVGLDRLNPVFNRGRDLHEATDLPVLGEVAYATVDTVDLSGQRTLMLVSGGAAGLVVAFLAMIWLSATFRFN
jgi:polysaccharide chain length determinant protein (PEP-CTERM system associated)